MNPLTLVLSGGSVRGFGILGAIQYIDETRDIKNISSYFGTSAGAMISYLLCMGLKPLEIVHMILKENLLEKLKMDINIDDLLESQGIVNFDCITEELELITLAKFGKLFTLRTLYEELGKELGCVTFNYTKGKMEYLHYSITPNIPCLKAIQMSSSIPFMFNKCIHNNCLYIDGGVVDNLPIRMALKLGKFNIIAVSMNYVSKSESTSITISRLINIPITEKTSKTIKKFRKRIPIIPITSDNADFNFNLSIPEIMDLFSHGYMSAKNILDL